MNLKHKAGLDGMMKRRFPQLLIQFGMPIFKNIRKQRHIVQKPSKIMMNLHTFMEQHTRAIMQKVQFVSSFS